MDGTMEPPRIGTLAPVQIDWEEAPCPLCAASNADALIEAADPLPGPDLGLRFLIVRCRDCGLAYTNPRPSPRCMGRFYPEDYTPHAYRNSAASRQKWRLWQRRDSLVPVLPLPPGGRLLDFGCGSGDLLQEMHQRGWRVTGLDLSPLVVRHIREQLGLTAFAGTLPHPELRPGTFEAVTMSQSLEHLHDPLCALREAHRLLVPGGRIAITVPNIEGLPFRWFGADWFGLDVPRHLTHFSPHTLARMLTAAGFEVGGVYPLRHNSWLRHSALLAARRSNECSLGHRLLRIRVVASLAGWYSHARQQANCILAVGIKAK
jgi:SAM-dependent methyltransferase